MRRLVLNPYLVAESHIFCAVGPFSKTSTFCSALSASGHRFHTCGVWRGEKHTPCPRSSQQQRRAMLAFAFIVTGFVSPAALLRGSQPVLPRVRRTTPLPPGRMARCICSGGRVGGRSKGWKPTESEERGTDAPPAWQWFGPVQRALAVLVPAVVIATACVPYGPLHGPAHVQPPSSVCQVPALRDPSSSARASTVIESEAELEVLECLSSSVNYPGSRNDIADARRDYVESPTALNDRLVAIDVKAELNRKAEGGQWTYPGWRADAARGFKSKEHTDQRAMRNVAKTMDLAQELHKTVPQRMRASVGTSFRSMFLYAFRLEEHSKMYFATLWILAFWAFQREIFEDPFEPPSRQEKRLRNDLAWRLALTLNSVLLALSASSAIGFCPLIFLTGFYGLMAVLRDPP